MKAMPPQVLARVLKLKGLDVERDEIAKEYSLELGALERKYEARYAPLYATRAEVVTGKLEVPNPYPYPNPNLNTRAEVVTGKLEVSPLTSHPAPSPKPYLLRP